MADSTDPGIQPWKAMKTMEENPNPNFDEMKNFRATEPTCGSGSSVSKPMDRRTGYGSLEDGAAVDDTASQKQMLTTANNCKSEDHLLLQENDLRLRLVLKPALPN